MLVFIDRCLHINDTRPRLFNRLLGVCSGMRTFRVDQQLSRPCYSSFCSRPHRQVPSETHLSRQSVTGAYEYDSQRQMVNDLCEYEKERMENVKRNHAKLVELGLEAPACEKPIKKRCVTSHAPKSGSGVTATLENASLWFGMSVSHTPARSHSTIRSRGTPSLSSTTMAKCSGKLQG